MKAPRSVPRDYAAAPPAELLDETINLIERRVRPIALLGYAPAKRDAALRLWTRLNAASAMRDVIPFIVRIGEQHCAYGFAAADWALELYIWSLTADAPPRVLSSVEGLLFGYGIDAIARHHDRCHGQASEARFSFASPAPVSRRRSRIRGKAGKSHPCSKQSR